MSSNPAAGPKYNAFTLVQGCYLTKRLCPFPALCIHPVSIAGQHDRLVDAVNGWLADLGYEARADAATLDLGSSPTLSLAVVDYITSGPTAQDAWRVGRAYVDLVLDVLALHRGAAGTPILTVLEPLETDEPPFISSDTAPYSGNLLGGVISGEDEAAIGKDILSAASNNLLRLWLSSTNDAIAETDHDFARVRWWNLLEAMAKAHHTPTGQPIKDDAGRPIFRLSCPIRGSDLSG